MKVIGITGSYAKTSCKNILKYFLEDNFNVIATEKNFNTPMGIALTIDKMTGEEDFLIAEMGARKLGDIKELCDMVKPSYGIVTGVCEQHLETFLSIDNIYAEKMQLPLSITDGVCVFNNNDKYVHKMYKNFVGKKISASVLKRGYVYADNLHVSSKGTSFTLHISDKSYKCKTNLLGRHNVINIVLCVALAKNLGVEDDVLVKKIENIRQISHRLEYSYINGIHILDDGYNANYIGIKSSLEVLSTFIGRKIIVSQGIVEMGKKSDRMNRLVGTEIANYANVVILCGVNRKEIETGLKFNNYKGELYIVRTLKQAQKILSKILKIGDVVLFQNDVPDVF